MSTAFTQPKNVKWVEDERLDIDDLSAVADLKDDQLQTFLKAMFEPGSNGLVFKGFDVADSSGPETAWDFNESWALAADGSVLILTSAQSDSVSLTPNATNYIHAYLGEADSDSDNRRFWNDVASPPEEVTQSTPTRQTRVVRFYVTSNSDVTPNIASFQTSAFIDGKLRYLVALYAKKTDSANVLSTIDFRQSWLPGGNQYPDANGYVRFDSTDVSGVHGLHSMFLSIANQFRKLYSRGDDAWWNQTLLLTDPINASVLLSLRQRISAAKATFATVAPSGSVYADYTSLAAALAATTTGEIRMKAGTHTILNIDFSGKSGITVSGEGKDVTKVLLAGSNTVAASGLIFGTGSTNITVRDLTLGQQTSPLGPVLDFTATSAADITFINCRLQPGVYAMLRAQAGCGKRVKFIDCEFELSSFGVFDVSGSTGWNPPNATVFEGCKFTPQDGTACLVSSAVQGSGVKNVRFVGCQFGDQSRGTWMGWTASLQYQSAVSGWPDVSSWQAEFESCSFVKLTSFIANGLAGKYFWVDFQFIGCTMQQVSVSTAALINHLVDGSTWDNRSRFVWRSCEVRHRQVFSTAGLANCNAPNLIGESSQFFTETTASTAADAMFFNIGNAGYVNGLTNAAGATFRFTGCEFYHAGYCWYMDLNAANANGSFFFFSGCSFFAAPIQGLTIGAGVALWLRHNGSGFSGTLLCVVVRECYFNTQSAKPMILEKGASAGKADASLQYTYTLTSDGSVSDSGVTLTGTWRSSDTPYRTQAFSNMTP